MPTLIVLIGLPGCGKSTYAAKKKEAGLIVISPDEIREELTGDMSDQSRNREVFSLAHKRTKEALRHGGSVVFDATNLTRRARNDLLSCIPDRHNTYVEYVLFRIPLEECLKRNRQRTRHVPEDVIRRMNNSFTFPVKEKEKYDRLTIVTSAKDLA